MKRTLLGLALFGSLVAAASAQCLPEHRVTVERTRQFDRDRFDRDRFDRDRRVEVRHDRDRFDHDRYR